MRPMEEVMQIAARLRAQGLPDALNRWLAMVPAELRGELPMLKETTTAAPAAQPQETVMPNTTTTEKTKTSAKAGAAPAVTKKPDVPETSAKEAATPKAKEPKAAKAPKAKEPKAAAAPEAGKKPKPETKTDIVDRMLRAKLGTTREKLSEATGWPTVNLTTASKRRPDHVLMVNPTGRVRLVAAADLAEAEKDQWSKA